MGLPMKFTKLITGVALTTSMAASVANAGALTDPIVEPAIVIEAASSSSSSGLLIPLLFLLLLGAAIAGSTSGGGRIITDG